MKENSTPSTFASTGMTPAEAITAQVEIYQKASRACGHKLLSIYNDLGLNHDEQHKGINDVAVQACQTWTEAVEDAESKRTALRLKIDECYKESQKMKCQLGDNVLEDDCQSLILSPSSPKRSLFTLYQEEKAKLEVWRTKRAERFEEYSKRQGDVNRLKTQLGLHVVPATRQPDISRTNMEYLQLEFEKLTDTKAKKLEELGKLLVQLDEGCAELEEEPDMILKEVHHSLRFNREATVGGLRQSIVESILQQEADVDLSERTFLSILGRMQDLKALKEERKARARDLLEVLNSLWNALDTSADDPSRAHFTKLLSSPSRLYARILEQSMAEVRKLQAAKTQLMIDLISIKKRELEAEAAATRLPVPNLDLLAEIHSTANNCGQAAEVLARLVRMTAQMIEQAEQRAPVLEQVVRLEGMRQESDWLKDYEADPNRLKGRNAHANLQRSLKAGHMRERLPAEIQALRAALSDWRLHHNCHFALDGSRNYVAEVLDPLDAELQQLVEGKANRARDRRQTLAGGGGPSREGSTWGVGGPKTPVKGGMGSSTRDPLTPRGGGAVTPRMGTTPRGAARGVVAQRPGTTGTRSPYPKASATPTRSLNITASPPPARRAAASAKPATSEPTARLPTPPPRTRVTSQVEKLIGRPTPCTSQLSSMGGSVPVSPAESVADSGCTDVTSRLDILSPTGRNKMSPKQKLMQAAGLYPDSMQQWDTSPSPPSSRSPRKLVFQKEHGLNLDLPR